MAAWKSLDTKAIFEIERRIWHEFYIQVCIQSSVVMDGSMNACTEPRHHKDLGMAIEHLIQNQFSVNHNQGRNSNCALTCCAALDKLLVLFALFFPLVK